MVWICRLHTFDKLSEEQMQELEQYCYQAAMKDPTFKFAVEGENSKIQNIIIECESRDHAHKRGTLFHHKFGDKDSVFYEVEWKG